MSDNASEYMRRFRDAISAHHAYRENSISLIAGQNVFTNEVGSLLSSDLGNRVVEYVGEEQMFPGMEEYLPIEKLAVNIIQAELGADAVEVRPVTGTLANFIVYHALLEPGDLVASISIGNGAHVSVSGRTLSHLGFNHVALPFSEADLTIDVERSVSLIRAKRPQLVVLGGSVVLFHEAIASIVDAARSVGTVVLYDAAHTIGLVLSGHAPNPLAQGCDLLSFTTCKTIAGPQHAFICGRRDLLKKIEATSRVWHSGYHLHETAAAVWAIIEAINKGPSYGATLVSNAKILAAALDAGGVPVLKNKRGVATETYMFLADVRTLGGGRLCEGKLASSGILVNRNLLPCETGQTAGNPSGLRIGVAEVTTLGMLETEMRLLGTLTAAALTTGDPSVREQVLALRQDFSRRRQG